MKYCWISLIFFIRVLFAILFTSSSLIYSSSGLSANLKQTDNSDKNSSPGTATITVIKKVAAACAAEPFRPGGTINFYCDCGTGAEIDCVAGSDTNSGTSPLAPRRTIENAAARFNKLSENDTVALCKGGAFNASRKLSIGSNRCGEGVACIDLREYTPPTFPGTAKPRINNQNGNILFSFDGNLGGVRLLNLMLVGDNGASGNNNWGFFFYRGAHDVTMCNLDIDAFDLAFHSGGDLVNNRIKINGNRITNSRVIGYLGSGLNTDISYNYWDGNGSSTNRDHTIYLSSGTNIQLIGNYIHGQYGSTCRGAPIVGHGSFDGLIVAGNVVDIDAVATTGSCWGIAFDHGGYPIPVYLRNARFTANTIKNGGNAALTVAHCPDCIVENNLILNETSVAWSGISIPTYAARTSPADDLSTRNLVRNNTIWYGPNATDGGIGIKVGTEGVGHVISNNSVYFNSPLKGNGVSCFSYPLTLGSYAFINNNHCYSAAPYAWEATHGSLLAWRTYAASAGFDTASFTGNPLFSSVGRNFTPAAGSRLIGKGSTTFNSASATDITGKPRPAPPSIGAFEQ